jgi:hypothetical protein
LNIVPSATFDPFVQIAEIHYTTSDIYGANLLTIRSQQYLPQNFVWEALFTQLRRRVISWCPHSIVSIPIDTITLLLPPDCHITVCALNLVHVSSWPRVTCYMSKLQFVVGTSILWHMFIYLAESKDTHIPAIMSIYCILSLLFH